MNRDSNTIGRNAELQRLTACMMAFLLATAAGSAGAQTFTSFQVPTHLCAGQSRTITFGFQSQNNVVVAVPVATLNRAETAFLPDGEPCPPNGCSYRSPITFTDFPASSRIRTVEDIKYVRLKIEHSYMGDIYINITCPNGQKADLIRYGGTGTSSCNDAIPESSIGWLSGSNVSLNTYFGDPVDDEDSETCDANAPDNRPGTGWSYCWSNNTTSGYTYAPGDGIIYRETNTSDDVSVDSSDVANLSNFYHPDESFSSLIGCPLNGSWYIEVVDGWGGDNGYIFDWELSLDPSLLPHACDLQSRSVSGSIAQRVNDSTYTLSAPATLTRDTAVDVLFRAVSTCGDTIDSTVHITLHANPDLTADTSVCDSLVYRGNTYRGSQPIESHLTTIHGCDSTMRLNLTVRRSSLLDTLVEVVENALPITIGGQSFNTEVNNHLITGLTNAAGCDSSIRLTLAIRQNWHTVVDSTLCEHQLPSQWNGLTLTHTDTYEVTLRASSGVDSTVTLHLTVHPDSHETVRDTVVENQLPISRFGHTFRRDTDTTLRFSNRWQCDSIIDYRLKVWRNYYVRFDTVICGAAHNVSWRGQTFAHSADTLLRHTTIHGSDSTIQMVIIMAPTYNIVIDTAICQGTTYRLGPRALAESGDYRHQFYSRQGCDSSVSVSLEVISSSADTLVMDACRSEGALFEGHHYDRSGTYTHRMLNRAGCDSLKTLVLTIGGERLLARANIIPTIVEVGDPTVEFTSMSREADSLFWSIGEFSTTNQHFFFNYPTDKDSLVVVLVAVDSVGCQDTFSTVLWLDRSAVTAPNAFTPNLETNNRWSLVVSDLSEIEVWIYSRQGALVHHYDQIDGSWDGKHDGTLCPQGTYVYHAQYRRRLFPNKLYNTTGTVTLIR